MAVCKGMNRIAASRRMPPLLLSQIPPLRGGSIPRSPGCPLLQGGTCLPEISKEEFMSIVNYSKSMQPLEKGHVLTGNLERRVYVVRYSAGMELPGDGGVRIAQKSRRNSSCFFIIPYGFHRTMHLRAVRILPWRRSPLSACRRYPLFRGSPGSFPPECRRLSWRW